MLLFEHFAIRLKESFQPGPILKLGKAALRNAFSKDIFVSKQNILPVDLTGMVRRVIEIVDTVIGTVDKGTEV